MPRSSGSLAEFDTEEDDDVGSESEEPSVTTGVAPFEEALMSKCLTEVDLWLMIEMEKLSNGTPDTSCKISQEKLPAP